jgi:hypothetical protein
VTVPLIAADVPHLRRDPVVAYMCDLFTRPSPFQPHVVRDIESRLDTIVQMLACHRCQVFEFLPYNQGIDAQVPVDEAERRRWLRDWFCRLIAGRADRFREAVCQQYGDAGARMAWIEAFEISEYAAPASAEDIQRLFPPADTQVPQSTSRKE